MSYNITEICKFLQVLFNTVLCTRGTFPKEAFDRKTEYNIVVYRSKYKDLDDYINNVCTSLETWFTQSIICSIRMAFYDNNTLVEQLKLNIHQLKLSNEIDLNQEQLHFVFASILVRVQQYIQKNKSQHLNETFQIFIDTNSDLAELTPVLSIENMPWVLHEETFKEELKITPIASCIIGNYKLNIDFTKL